MYRKIHLEVQAANLSLLKRQLTLIGQFRDRLVKLLATERADWDRLIHQYKLMGRVREVMAAYPKLREVRFKVLLAYTCDLCNAARYANPPCEQAEDLKQHRASLLYKDGGFRLNGDYLHLEVPEDTLALRLAERPDFEVAKVRVYCWAKDGCYYGTFSPAVVAEPELAGESKTVQALVGKLLQAKATAAPSAEVKECDLEEIRARMRAEKVLAPVSAELASLHRDLARVAEHHTRWFQFLADQLQEQQEELGKLRAELAQRRSLPWLN